MQEEVLVNFDLNLFKKVFKEDDPEDPFMWGGSYEITESHVFQIQSLVKHKIDLNKYTYFFSTYEEPDDSDKEYRTGHFIAWFDRSDNDISGEEELEDFDEKYFQKIFNHSDEELPYKWGEYYDIKKEHVSLIQPLIKHKIDMKKNIYSFGTHGVEVKQKRE